MRKNVGVSELLGQLDINMTIADEELNDNNIEEFIFRFNAIKEDIQLLLLYDYSESISYKDIKNYIDNSLYNKLRKSYDSIISRGETITLDLGAHTLKFTYGILTSHS